jgi:hypothetical protein
MEIEFYHLVLIASTPPLIISGLFYKFIIPPWFRSFKEN